MTEKTKKYENLPFLNESEIKFTKNNLKWTPCSARPPRTVKDPVTGKYVEIPDDTDDKKGEHFLPEYTIDVDGKMKTGLPRIKHTNRVSVKLMQKKKNKFRVVVILRKNDEKDAALIAALQKYELLYKKACLESSGEQHNWSPPLKNSVYNETVWETVFTRIVRDDNDEYVTITLNIPFYTQGDKKIGTTFNMREGSTNVPITDINEYNLMSYLCSGTKIKIGFTIKEHWVGANANGVALQANTIIICNKPPKIVIPFNKLAKHAQNITMELYQRDFSMASASSTKVSNGAFSIGGGLFYTQEDSTDAPFIYMTPVSMIKWTCKSDKYTDKEGRPNLQMQFDLSENSELCVHATKFREGLNEIDRNYKEFLLNNREMLLAISKPKYKNVEVLNDDWINKGKTMVSVTPESDRNKNKRYTLYAKIPRYGKNINTKVYDISDMIAAQKEANPELAAEIDNLSSDYYKNIFPTDLNQDYGDNYGTPLVLNDNNIDKILSPGTQCVCILQSERWGSYVPEADRGSVMGHGHGIYTNVLMIFIVRKDEIAKNYSNGAFDDDDIDDEPVVVTKKAKEVFDKKIIEKGMEAIKNKGYDDYDVVEETAADAVEEADDNVPDDDVPEEPAVAPKKKNKAPLIE